MLRLGKYRGLKFEEAAEHDRSYAAWVLRERALPKTLGDYKAYLHETRGGILNIGKHRGKWFKEVVEQDPRHGGRALKEKPPLGSAGVGGGGRPAHLSPEVLRLGD